MGCLHHNPHRCRVEPAIYRGRMRRPPPAVLSIAGSDPSGGAGIQADLKTFSSLGAYGMTVLTAPTAQNTQGVSGVHPVPAAFVEQQLKSLISDVRIDAVKTGMLGTLDVIEVVADFVETIAAQGVPVVIDPVMVATSGDRLMDDDAAAGLLRLMRAGTLITPNLAEAAALLDLPPATDEQQMEHHARALLDLGASAVLIKGGHLVGDAVDLWVDHDGVARFESPRIQTRNTHGTGCSLSSALAALRPRHDDWHSTVRAVKRWLTGALEHADELEVGAGSGPVHHFFDADW